MEKSEKEKIAEEYPKEFQGILLMIVASFMFAVMAYFVKMLSKTMTVPEIALYRNLVALAILFTSLRIYPPASKGGNIKLLALRGIFGFTAMFCYFFTISTVPLATAATLVKTAPFFTAILAYFFLKEKISKNIWSAVFIGFIGILMILRPSPDMNLLGAFTGLMSGFVAAMAYTSIRQLTKYYGAREIVTSFSVAGITGSSILIIIDILRTGISSYDYYELAPHGIEWFYVVCVGLLATFSQWVMSRSYFFGRASVLATVGYSSLIFSVFAGMLAGDKFPGPITIAGIVLVAISGILVAKK